MEGARIIKRLDHVTVRVNNPEPLFSMLVDQLLLPRAWPITSYPLFTHAGVHLGNANLEILQIGQRPHATRAARLYGLVFEMEPHELSLPELDRRGIQHTPPTPFYVYDEQGWQTTAWTSVILGGLIRSSTMERTFVNVSQRLSTEGWERTAHPTQFNRRFRTPFLYDRIFRRWMVSGIQYNPAWYAANIQEEPTRAGLEVTGLHEVAVGTSSFPTAYQSWKNLLADHEEVVKGIWRLESGVHVRLLQHNNDGLLGMTWQVESLNRAAQFLHKRGMFGKERNKAISIAPRAIFGLHVRLVQA